MSPDRKAFATDALEVFLNGYLAGTLVRLPDDRIVWTFDSDYLADETRPTLSLSFKGKSGQILTNLGPTRVKAPPFFSNLLPEGHLREYLAERGSVSPEREFFLLGLLGQDLPGAVIMRPAGQQLALDAEAPAPVAGATRDGVLRFSLAGMQLKFSALMEAHGGLTIPVQGVGGTWIAKLPSTRYEAVPENEYVMMTLAEKAGITIPETRLVPLDKIQNIPTTVFSGNGQALVVKRFDRETDGRRIHMEDFAQVFGVYPLRKYARASYEDLARVLWAEAGEEALVEFVRRLAATVLIGNADMHLKNWSIIYPDGRTPALSPAYDFVSTVPYIDEPVMALSLGRTKEMSEIDEERFRRFALRANLPDQLVTRIAVETEQRLREAWRNHDAKDLLPERIRSAIAAHMSRVRIASSRVGGAGTKTRT